MEIKVLEIYEKFEEPTRILNELNELILGKTIKLYEFDEDSKNYDYIDEYKIEDLRLWEDQIVFTFGPDEWDICSLNKTDLINID